MNFDFFIKNGQVRKASVDKNLAKSLSEQTKKDMEFFDNLEINEVSIRKLVSNYYDFLRSKLEAIAILDGYKIYSHDAFTYYLKEKSELSLSVKFDRFRKLRNGINYYGEKISIVQGKEVIEDIKKIITYLINKYLKDLI
jgi:hypothetical protein